MMDYILQILIAIDQLLNAIIGGPADETLSSRAYRMRHNKYWNAFRVILDLVFTVVGHSEHCREAYVYEYIRSRRKRKHK